ncbi:GerMN domain-containing protein [Orenia marismortui]|uniref:GerMN domain-containing protein n=1 Tax=Orenia marismortui TaxID=46469 RepID=UPI0003746FE0|nr:GerMN domain-containing protein [Orenia marismortui]
MIDLKSKKIYMISILVIILILYFSYLNFFKTREVKLYFSDKEAQYLLPESRKLKVSNLYQSIVEELIEGPESKNLEITIPSQTRLIDIKLEDGTALVNFSKELKSKHWGGSTGEIITVYSIVNTLTSLEEIDQVRILISGKKIDTLVGHLELDKPLGFNSKLLIQ